jgi:hypothetical protein
VDLWRRKGVFSASALAGSQVDEQSDEPIEQPYSPTDQGHDEPEPSPKRQKQNHIDIDHADNQTEGKLQINTEETTKRNTNGISINIALLTIFLGKSKTIIPPRTLYLLPDELLTHILSFLHPFQERPAVAGVSRKFHRICNDPCLWRRLDVEPYYCIF